MTDIKYKILALFGKSGSGKDAIFKYLSRNYNVNPIISYTSRPKREREQDGIDYHFITVDDFITKICNGSLLEFTKFNNWYYGTGIETLDASRLNIGVFNLEGIRTLLKNSDKLNVKVYPYYIKCNDKTRMLRALNRENNPDCLEICRRFIEDERDFKKIFFMHSVYVNTENKSFENILKDKTVNDLLLDNND